MFDKLIKFDKNGQWELLEKASYKDFKTGKPAGDKHMLIPKAQSGGSIISHIEHNDEGGINSSWKIHYKNGTHKKAHSIDGESPKWSNSGESVGDTHPHLANALDNTQSGYAHHKNETITHHDETGKHIKTISSKKPKR